MWQIQEQQFGCMSTWLTSWGRWRSWLSHLSNTQKVLSSNLGRLIVFDRAALPLGRPARTPCGCACTYTFDSFTPLNTNDSASWCSMSHTTLNGQ